MVFLRFCEHRAMNKRSAIETQLLKNTCKNSISINAKTQKIRRALCPGRVRSLTSSFPSHRRFVVVRSTSDRSFLGSRFSSSWTSDFDPILLKEYYRARHTRAPRGPSRPKLLPSLVGIRFGTWVLKSSCF